MAESSPPAADVLKEGFLTKQGRHNAIVSIYVREIPRETEICGPITFYYEACAVQLFSAVWCVKIIAAHRFYAQPCSNGPNVYNVCGYLLHKFPWKVASKPELLSHLILLTLNYHFCSLIFRGWLPYLEAKVVRPEGRIT